MTAWLLFKHSISMLLRNRIEVLRIFLAPMILMCACGAALFGLAFATIGEGTAPPFPVVVLIIAGIIGILVVLPWPIVAWHRYVLGEEPVQGVVPPFHKDRILGYFGTGLALGFLVSLVVIPVAIVTLTLASAVGKSFGAIEPFIAPGLAIFPTYVFNRLSITLVASALGNKDFWIRDAWRATAGATDTILILSIIMIGLQTVLEQISVMTATSIGPIISFASSVIVALIQVSLLTTLYGYFVEKRPV